MSLYKIGVVLAGLCLGIALIQGAPYEEITYYALFVFGFFILGLLEELADKR